MSPAFTPGAQVPELVPARGTREAPPWRRRGQRLPRPRGRHQSRGGLLRPRPPQDPPWPWRKLSPRL